MESFTKSPTLKKVFLVGHRIRSSVAVEPRGRMWARIVGRAVLLEGLQEVSSGRDVHIGGNVNQCGPRESQDACHNSERKESLECTFGLNYCS